MRITPFSYLNQTFFLRQTSGKPITSETIHLGEDIFVSFNHETTPTIFGSLAKHDMKVLRDINDIEQFKA